MITVTALLAAGCVNTGDSKKSGDDKSSKSTEENAGETGTDTSEPVTLTLKGSDTMVILGQRWAEEYMGQNANYTIQVTGGGSGTGIAALINKTTDIAQSSRPIKEEEKKEAEEKNGEEIVEVPVALDGLAIFLNDKNKVNELTLEEIQKIYTGEITNWKDLGGTDSKIVLYGRESNSGTYVYFKEEVLDEKDFAPDTQTLSGTAAVANAVANDKNGIGYGGVAYAKGVKHAAVSTEKGKPGIQPSLETVQSNEYPISRFLYWYVPKATLDRPEVAALVEWVLSENDGQALAEEVGYYPLKK